MKPTASTSPLRMRFERVLDLAHQRPRDLGAEGARQVVPHARRLKIEPIPHLGESDIADQPAHDEMQVVVDVPVFPEIERGGERLRAPQQVFRALDMRLRAPDAGKARR